MANEGDGSPAPGPATVTDPSKNVRDQVAAEARRQDDLRVAEQQHVREVLELRTKLGDQDSACAGEIAELRASYAHRIDTIRENHAHQLREAEAARIDAIRSVDVEAVQRAAEVQSTAADRLAKQVTDSAEAMRTQVSAAATAADSKLATAVAPLTEAVAELRQAQYEAQGQKTQVVETQAKSTVSTGWIVAGIGGAALFLTMIALIVTLLATGSP